MTEPLRLTPRITAAAYKSRLDGFLRAWTHANPRLTKDPFGYPGLCWLGQKFGEAGAHLIPLYRMTDLPHGFRASDQDRREER